MRSLLGFGPYHLDLERRILLRDTENVQLPAKALELLQVLVQHRGQVLSKDFLMEAVWPDSYVEEANLSQNIHLLRRALGERKNDNRFIVTVPGRGYTFVAETRQALLEDSSTNPAPARSPVSDANLEAAQKTSLGLQFWNHFVARRTRHYALWLLAIAAAVSGLVGAAPWFARTINNRGVDAQNIGNVKAAIGYYQMALRLRSCYAEAFYNLADAYEELTEFDKAAGYYLTAIECDPHFYEAYNNLARLDIVQREDYQGALRLLDTALTFTPKEPSVQYSLLKNRGWANYKLGFAMQAKNDLERAIDLDRDRGPAHCLLAKFLADRNAKEALPEWEYCMARSAQADVEPEWRHEAVEKLGKEANR